jgi:putative ABC transport system permease protein
MLFNYLKIALRNMQRHKLYSAINILSFALGIACSLAILLWVRHEWSVDRFHTRLDRLYQVQKVYTVSNSINVFASLPGLFADAAKADITSLEGIVSVLPNHNVLQAGTEILRESGVYAHAALFDIFSFPMLAGATARLDQPSTIALSRSLAQKLFGTTNALGQTVQVDAKTTCIVVAVFADIPETSSLQFEYVLSMKEYIQTRAWAREWGTNSFEVYILRRELKSLAPIPAVKHSAQRTLCTGTQKPCRRAEYLDEAINMCKNVIPSRFRGIMVRRRFSRKHQSKRCPCTNA